MARTARARQVDSAAATITSFTRVSKAGSLLLNDPLAAKKTAALVQITPSRKRKASDEDEEETLLSTRTEDSTKRACRRDEPQPAPTVRTTPTAKGKRIAKATPSKARKAHKPSATTVLARSNRESKTTQTKLDIVFKKASAAAKNKGTSNGLPEHLAELVHLHKAFLKTVLLQFSHSGSHVPLDIQTLAPNVSRSWGKRQVTVEDLRRCVALQSSTDGDASPFILSDYGRGKLCVELRSRGATDATLINEDALCRQFEANLKALCAERATDEMTDVEEIALDKLSLADLPKADITNMTTGVKANPLLTKGQQALAELKNGMATKQQSQDIKQAPVNQPMVNPDGTKMSLLDRIRHKQLAKANGPSAPSGPELERRAALNRVADVSATISMLSLSNPISLPRQAFTMAAILDRLKDSLRVPVSREEGTACVKLIASEVAPEWLRVVSIGGRENVVVQRTAQPVDRVLQDRVNKLLG
ncbi:DNA mismatch repair protein Msh2 [Sarocladium implicatum]|nr:DNA mismatch repair protein Msh2 [Sarocladium implicatum]